MKTSTLLYTTDTNVDVIEEKSSGSSSSSSSSEDDDDTPDDVPGSDLSKHDLFRQRYLSINTHRNMDFKAAYEALSSIKKKSKKKNGSKASTDPKTNAIQKDVLDDW